MSSRVKNIEENLNTILYCNNWNNIIVRNFTRKELTSGSLDDRLFLEFMNETSLDSLIELRKRVFKLVCDLYIENFIGTLPMIVLKDIKSEGNNYSLSLTGKYFIKLIIINR